MSLKLQQHLSQKLTISHKMQQSLSILALSHEELKQAIQKELLENPLLETVETNESNNSDKNQSKISNFKIYDTLESTYEKRKKNSEAPMEDFLTEPISLKSFVLNQVEMSFFPREIKVILPFFISSLDDRGYLNLDLNELALQEKIPLSLLNKSLSALQSLEPMGLGGRNLEECLLIQLRHKKEDTTIPSLIIRNHLQNIKEKKYKAIAYDLNISLKEFKRCLKIILSLDPSPCRNFSSQPTVFVRPDLYIYKENEDYQVFLNKEELPQLKLSYEYTQSIKRNRTLKAQEKKYLNEKINSAHWFICSIQQRQEKMKKMAYCLIKHQKAFFEKGFFYLKPLTMQELANEMAVHVSTISRTVRNKYVYTAQGIVPLKIFFQKGLVTDKGGAVSVLAIKRIIKKWIEEEEPQKPLSDEELREKVCEHFQISLLRRSLSQYRSSMSIPPARVRKWNFLNSQSLSSPF